MYKRLIDDTFTRLASQLRETIDAAKIALWKLDFLDRTAVESLEAIDKWSAEDTEAKLDAEDGRAIFKVMLASLDSTINTLAYKRDKIKAALEDYEGKRTMSITSVQEQEDGGNGEGNNLST